MPKLLATLVLVLAAGWRLTGAPLAVPNRPDSFKFAVLGDNGSGDSGQFDLAKQMALVHREFAFELVAMVGDNFYGSQGSAERLRKFDAPYKPLLDAGVSFQAAIGNHDELDTINYQPLNMGGQRYYTYVRRQVRFFVLDTNVLDPPQMRWFESVLKEAQEPWRIAYFHHPLYGNAGRHGSAVDLRVLLEPLLVKYGVSVVFTGHDHVYERLKPQKGITYFVTGSGGKLRKGDMQPSETTAASYDLEQAFLIAEVAGDEMFFQTISRSGGSVDSGVIRRVTAARGTM
ncbi:MAG TPA: metallophosphoesterase [Vicinamibacterales bacterium]|nr:metallophosphoesterase [Vicinamibacterales bacterium]